MGPPLFSELPKTANDLFTQEGKDFGGRVEISSKLKNGVVLSFFLPSNTRVDLLCPLHMPAPDLWFPILTLHDGTV